MTLQKAVLSPQKNIKIMSNSRPILVISAPERVNMRQIESFKESFKDKLKDEYIVICVPTLEKEWGVKIINNKT